VAPHDKEICRIAAASLEEKNAIRDEYWDLDQLTINRQFIESAAPALEQYYSKEAALCCFYRFIRFIFFCNKNSHKILEN
jgi:hypothetical protein